MLVISNSEQVFMKHFRRVIIASFVFVHLPAYAACAIRYATLIWGYQALVECIEVPVILLSIFVLTLIETKIESSHLRGDTYLPLTGMKKYADDVAVMSALPLHRSLTKERDEESKTENYSISCDADRQSHKELEYDVELRKKALMSIVNHIKNPERDATRSSQLTTTEVSATARSSRPKNTNPVSDVRSNDLSDEHFRSEASNRLSKKTSRCCQRANRATSKIAGSTNLPCSRNAE